MKECSNTYLSTINNSTREKFYIKIILGAINIEAQTNASIANPSQVFFSSKEIFDSNLIDFPYATFEKERTSANGKFFFPCEKESEILFNGYVSDEISDENCNISVCIDFFFPDKVIPLDIKGLTLSFDDISFPTEFNISWGDNYTPLFNNKPLFENYDEVFCEIKNHFILTITKMNKPFSRFRLKDIKFGVGLVFTDDEVTKADLKVITNPISNSIPSTDFSFTIINVGYEYDLENPSSTINFLEKMQDCSVSLGYEIEDSQKEWFKLASPKLKTWSSEQYQATFKCADLLNFYDADYIKGKYYSGGISLYNLFIDVVTDMGLEDGEYSIDEYFKTVFTHNPIPICKHPEALQMISNAGRGCLHYDSNGVLTLSTNFIPDYYFNSTLNEPYSNPLLLKKGCGNHYATYEVMATTPNSFFMPEGQEYIDVAYASSCISDNNGYFANKPEISVVMESSFITLGINIEFGNTVANNFVITTYLRDDIVETKEYTNTSKIAICHERWKRFDKITITFSSTSERNQRIYVNKIYFGDITDYYISFDEYFDTTPKGEIKEKIRTLYFTAKRFSEQTIEEEISTIDIDCDSSEKTEIVTFDEPRIEIRVENATIISCGSYYVEIKYGIITEATKVLIYGKKFSVSYVNVPIKINDKGIDKYFSNDLVDDVSMAKKIAKFVGAYVHEIKEYSFNWRGDPRLESNDSIYIQNRFNDRMPFRVITNQITYNQGAVSGKVKGKKIYVD